MIWSRKVKGPTIRFDLKELASDDVTPEKLDEAIAEMQKYGVSALLTPDTPKMETANLVAKAIANLETREGFGAFFEGDKLKYDMLKEQHHWRNTDTRSSCQRPYIHWYE